ncbi:hypothetical protein D3C72_2010110 [compost metagenome]
MRPSTRLQKVADSWVMRRALSHSMMAFRRELPDSRTIQSWISSARASMISTARFSTAARSSGRRAAHSCCAVAAAA